MIVCGGGFGGVKDTYGRGLATKTRSAAAETLRCASGHPDVALLRPPPGATRTCVNFRLSGVGGVDAGRGLCMASVAWTNET